jgi:putative ABC transport system permease protein
VTPMRIAMKNACRNKRRTLLTALSLTFSFLLLIFMMTIWRAFYIDQWSLVSASHIVCRHRTSLAFFLPSYYRKKISQIPGVVAVIPLSLFEGDYKDPKSGDFAQIGTDPDQFFKAYPEYQIPHTQIIDWQRDPAGAIAGSELAGKERWKIGDKLIIEGGKFSVNLELTLRGIFKSPYPINAVYFNWKYVQNALRYDEDQLYLIQADSPQNVAKISTTVDGMFRNSPEPTKTEAEQAFDIDLISMLGNVRLFILSICAAVLFATLLVSGNTLAMSVRERTREVAMLKMLGFPRGLILRLFVTEALALSLLGWLMAAVAAYGMVYVISRSGSSGVFAVLLRIRPTTICASLVVAGLVGVLSAAIPSYHVSRINIVEGLRHIG